MAKKSKALREIEAMKHAAESELDDVEAQLNAIAARLDTLTTLENRIAKEDFKPGRKKAKEKSTTQILDEAAIQAMARRPVPVAS